MTLAKLPTELLLMIAEELSIEDLSHFRVNSRLKNILHWAIIKGRGSLAKFAISKGADLNEPCRKSVPGSGRNERIRTPLHLAIMYDSPDVIRALMEAGAQLFAPGEGPR